MFSTLTGPAGKELTIMCAGAARAAVTRLAEDFQAATGNAVSLTYGTVGALKERAAAGESADIIVVTTEAIAGLVGQGKVAADTVREIGKVGVGLAVRAAAQLPDISTPETLRQTLLAVRAVAYPDPAKGATSGIHFAKVIEQLGIADAVKAKSVLGTGGYVVEAVADGRADLGVQQITEILPVAGVTLVGPLPPELQKITAYSVGRLSVSPAPGLAAAFLRFLAEKRSAAALRAAGFGQF